MPVNAGQHRHRLILYERLSIVGEYGEPIDQLRRVNQYWCSVANTRNETVGDTLRQDQNELKLITRYNKTIEQVTNSHFIEFKGQMYDIDSVLNPLMLNERLEITCTLRGGGFGSDGQCP